MAYPWRLVFQIGEYPEQSRQVRPTVRPSFSNNPFTGCLATRCKTPFRYLTQAGALAFSVGPLVITLAIPWSRDSSDLYIWLVPIT